MKKIFIVSALIFTCIFSTSCSKADTFKNTKNTETKKEIFKVDNYYHIYRGIKDEKGKILLKPIYFDINEYEGYYYTKPFPEYKVYSLQGEKLLDIKDASIEYYDKDFAIVRDVNGCYLTDAKGKKRSKHVQSMALEPIFKKLILFWESNEDKNIGVMNIKGKILSKNAAVTALLLSTENGGFISNSENGDEIKTYLIDNNGKRKEISEEEREKYATAYENKQNKGKLYMADWAFSKNSEGEEIVLWGIDYDRETVIPKKYEGTSIAIGNTKYFGFKENNLWGVKTIPDEKTVLKPMFKENIKVLNDYILVNKAPKVSVFDKNLNKIFESYDVEGIGKFQGEYLSAHKQDKFKTEFGFVNKKGEPVIDFKYKYVHAFSEGLAAAENHKKLWGYINEKGETVIDFKYGYAGDFKDGKARVEKTDGTYATIDKSGKPVKE